MNVFRTGSSLFALLLSTAASGCDGPDVFIPFTQFGGPAGIIDGSLTYSGPPPCTRNGRVVGAAIVLGFDVRLLPPPEGLGTSAASLGVISGDKLFAGVRDQIPDAGDGSLRCPSPGAAPITVSADWALGPLSGGTYQVRSFYDRDGDFDPSFSIANLPTAGDVGGGAIVNAAEALAGDAPIFREITLGVPDGSGGYVIPDSGSRVGGVAISLGLVLPLERPVFHAAEVIDTFGMNTDPNNVVMASDYQMQAFSVAQPADTEKSFIRFRLHAGVPMDEAEKAAKSPFFFPVGPTDTPSFLFTRQDVNGDGVIDAEDHVPDADAVPSLFPLSIFTKLSGSSGIASQTQPAIVLQGLTIYKTLVSTALAPVTLNDPQPDVFVGVRPATLCLYPSDPSRGGVLVVSRATDSMGNALIVDQPAVEATLSTQFGREIKVQYGCLPQGRYAMNLVYGSGQAWTLPNEAGVCADAETPQSATQCGTRARLKSQSVTLTIGKPNDPAYCTANPTPKICTAE